MSVDLTLYLLKPEVTQINNVIPEEKCGIDGYEQVSAHEGFAEEGEMACWVKNNALATPSQLVATAAAHPVLGDALAPHRRCHCVGRAPADQRGGRREQQHHPGHQPARPGLPQSEQPYAGALSCVLEVARRAITRMREGRKTHPRAWRCRFRSGTARGRSSTAPRHARLRAAGWTRASVFLYKQPTCRVRTQGKLFDRPLGSWLPGTAKLRAFERR